jgi:hypothetical protein
MVNALRDFPTTTDQASRETLNQAERRGTQWMKELAPVRSGFLRSRIYGYMYNAYTIGLVSGADYSAPVEFGSRPHEIRAVRANYLRFRGSSGEWVFRKRVWHPGTSPRPFVMPAVRRVLKFIPQRFMEIMRVLLERVGFT